MFRNLFKNYIYPVATLSGGIIGVGFLSLPYITLQVGILPMFFYIVFLTVVVICIHVIFGQICLKTPDNRQFAGLVGFYLGPLAKKITLVLMLWGSFGVLLAYIIVGGEFLTAILQPFFGGTVLLYSSLYFIAGSALVYFGIKAISRFEFLALVALLISLTLIAIKGFGQIHIENIFFSNPHFFSDPKIMFLPYGALIFSLWGAGLIPEAEEMLATRKKTLKKVIIVSTLIPAGIYLAFILLILGLTGGQTTESALPGLKSVLGQEIFLVALFVGFIATFAAFVSQGLILKKTFVYDMGFGKTTAWIATCFSPLILFLLGFHSFIALISFTGGFLLSIDGMLILLMYKKIGGKNRVIYPLALIFLLGMVYQVIYFVK